MSTYLEDAITNDPRASMSPELYEFLFGPDRRERERIYEADALLYDSHCPECRRPSDPARGGDHRDH